MTTCRCVSDAAAVDACTSSCAEPASCVQALHEQADALGHRLKGMQEVHDQMGDSLRQACVH